MKFWHLVQKWNTLRGKADLKGFIWFEHDANNAKVVGFIPVWATHLTAGLDDPCGFFQVGVFCDLWQVNPVCVCSLSWLGWWKQSFPVIMCRISLTWHWQSCVSVRTSCLNLQEENMCHYLGMFYELLKQCSVVPVSAVLVCSVASAVLVLFCSCWNCQALNIL